MQLSEAVEEYRYAKLHLSPDTVRWYMDRLGPFVRWCEQEDIALESLRVGHFRRFLEHLRTKKNPRTNLPFSTYTLHGYAQVVKGFLSWCSQEDGLDDIVAETLPKKLRKEMPKVEKKIIETFSQEQIKRLFTVCEKECSSTLQVRDEALLSLLIDTGLRAQEVCCLTLEDVRITPTESYVLVRKGGKGMQQRSTGIGRQTRLLLRKYIERYRRAPSTERHVFLGRYNEEMTPSGLYQIIERLGEWARITGVRCSPHTFRHTFAVSYLRAGGSVFDLSRLLGHSSVKVTEIYTETYKVEVARSGISVMDSLK